MRASTPLLAVCGTRPEVIKMAPVVKALRRRGHRVILVFTGQHPDLAPQMLAEAGLTPDVDLAVHQPGNSPAQLLAGILTHLPPVIAAWRPMMILVQGDTVSAMAGALAGNYARVPVAHIEAGLRTHDRDEPFPEEMHRCVIAPLATLHFAPTPRAAMALEREGIDPANIHMAGNTAIDAVLATADLLDADPEFAHSVEQRLPFALDSDRPLLLATVHRRENIGARLSSIAAGIARLAGFCEMEVVLPLHPNPAVHGLLRARLAGLDGVHLIPPVDHATMV
ncbi:MAG: UDP-N-acetylglucosamine 2-epimerase (non-hydrolyzing), partial [Sphingomonadaceae bacterium]